MAKIRKEFTNKSITPLRKDKPHIVFIDGYWRVSPFVKGYWPRWSKAHSFVYARNDVLRDGLSVPAFYDMDVKR